MPYSSWTLAIIGFIRWAHWQKITVIASDQQDVAALALSLARLMDPSKGEAAFAMSFSAEGVDALVLGLIKARNRIVLFMGYGSQVLSIANAARVHGLTLGWAWLGLDTVQGAEQFATDLDIAREEAKLALSYWLYFELRTSASSSFFHNASVADSSKLASEYGPNMYDAILLYAMTAWKHPRMIANGAFIVEAMKNESFDGMTGRVTIDDGRAIRQSIRVSNYVLGPDETMVSTEVGVCDAPTMEYFPLPDAKLLFPGGTATKPVDTTLSCESGQFIAEGRSCELCPPGTSSNGGVASACIDCSAGVCPSGPISAPLRPPLCRTAQCLIQASSSPSSGSPAV